MDGGVPQSSGQLHWFSPPLQVPSPHSGGGPQSIAQLKPSSLPSQTPSPQHEGTTGSATQVLPSPVQRLSLQVTPYWAVPSPQQ